MKNNVNGISTPLGAAVILIIGVFASGCSSLQNASNREFNTTFGKKHATTNVYRQEVPEHLRRIAVLPFHKGNFKHVDFGEIERNFALELSKTNRFEMIPISVDSMMELFAQERYSSIENLPTELLGKLHEAYAIDGVLLVDISYFRAYRPVGLGVRLKLLDGRTGEIVWAVDEVYDSSDHAVANAAKVFYKSESIVTYPMNAADLAINSPNRFSKYVANSVFSTIYLQKD